MIRIRTERPTGGRKALALGLLLATLAAASLLLTVRSAYASTTFTVNVTNDLPDANVNDGACDAVSTVPGDQCTLRAAIQEANATSGADTIGFNIPGGGGKPSLRARLCRR